MGVERRKMFAQGAEIEESVKDAYMGASRIARTRVRDDSGGRAAVLYPACCASWQACWP